MGEKLIGYVPTGANFFLSKKILIYWEAYDPFLDILSY